MRLAQAPKQVWRALTEPDGDGTRLSMRHNGADGSACQAVNELLGTRWQFSTLRRALPRYLERQGRSV